MLLYSVATVACVIFVVTALLLILLCILNTCIGTSSGPLLIFLENLNSIFGFMKFQRKN